MHRQHGMTVLVVHSLHEGHLFECCVRTMKLAMTVMNMHEMRDPAKDAEYDGVNARMIRNTHEGRMTLCHMDTRCVKKTFFNAGKVCGAHKWDILPTKNRHANT